MNGCTNFPIKDSKITISTNTEVRHTEKHFQIRKLGMVNAMLCKLISYPTDQQ